MFVKLVAEWIQCAEPTDVGRDETYFTITGGGNRGPVARNQTRVAPQGPEDYFPFEQGTSHTNITLWEDFLPHGSSIGLSVALREQDNAQLSAILNLAANLSSVFVSGIIAAATGANFDLGQLARAVSQLTTDLVTSFQTDADDTIGAFGVAIENFDDKVKLKWNAGPHTRLSSTQDDQLSAEFHLSGIGSYAIRLSLQRSSLWQMVNSNSSKVLDIPDGNPTPGVQLQQFIANGDRNQAWFFQQSGSARVYSLGRRAVPGGNIFIRSDLNGMAVDLRGGRIPAGAAVQQFDLHGGFNQQWGWCAHPDFPGEFVFPSAHSLCVLDIANASPNNNALLCAFTWHGGGNQRWRLEKIDYPIELAA